MTANAYKILSKLEVKLLNSSHRKVVHLVIFCVGIFPNQLLNMCMF